MATVHDFHLVGYSNDVDARTIVLCTEWRYAGPPLRKVDAVFEGPKAYAFASERSTVERARAAGRDVASRHGRSREAPATA